MFAVIYFYLYYSELFDIGVCMTFLCVLFGIMVE